MESLEYLYWLDMEGNLHHYIGTYRDIIFACKASGAEHHWCYAPFYQFNSPWVCYGSNAAIKNIIGECELPTEVRALHLLIFRGV